MHIRWAAVFIDGDMAFRLGEGWDRRSNWENICGRAGSRWMRAELWQILFPPTSTTLIFPPSSFPPIPIDHGLVC